MTSSDSFQDLYAPQIGPHSVPPPGYAVGRNTRDGTYKFIKIPIGGFTSREAHVRYMATSRPAIRLDREMRQEAARDPKLAWDETTRMYVRVSKGAGRSHSTANAAPVPSDPSGAEPLPAQASPSRPHDQLAASADRPPAPHENF